jgi:subtilisin family serine protease
MNSWWKQLRQRSRGLGDPVRPATVSAKARLALEALEDRLTPSALLPDEMPAGQIAGTPTGASTFSSIIGLDAIRSTTPYKGDGYTVAVLDTGIDYNHPALGGGWGKRVVAGWDFVNNDADPMDDNGHGTHLAGIIGSSDPAHLGVAPDVNFVALKVLDRNNAGAWNNIDAALRWVAANQAKYHIVAVNLSLGSGNYTTNPYPLLENDFVTLKGQGVFTAIASGNGFYTYNSQPGLGYPSGSSYVVSVGAVWADNFGKSTFSSGATDFTTTADRIISITQRDKDLGILAPGAWITSTAPGGGFKAMGGTSMATAVVSGAAALLHQALDANGQSDVANQDTILGLLRSTGTTLNDGDDENDNVVNTGLNFKRLNLQAALNAVPQPPTLAPVPDQTIAVGGSAVLLLRATDVNRDTLTYSTRIVDDRALAYQLRQQFGFKYLGQYYTNSRGANEKWITDKNGVWYGIFPNGELRKWAGSLTETLKLPNLVAKFGTAYYADPSLLWNAPAASFPPITLTSNGIQLIIKPAAGWSGTVTLESMVSDGTFITRQQFKVTVAAVTTSANAAPVLAPLTNRTMPHSQDKLLVTLAATDANSDPITFTAKVLPSGTTTPPVAVSVVGTQLTVNPAVSFAGTFTVAVTASDGKATDTKSFAVTVTNAAPVLGTIPNQTLARGVTSATVPLTAIDPDGDSVTFTARALTPDAKLYQLDTQLQLAMYQGSYHTNIWGANEKWLVGAGGAWYGLLPDGRLYRWGGTFARTVTSANLVATLDPSVYAEPRLLWDARPATTPPLTFSVVGNQLTVQRPASLTGVYVIEVTVSDGQASSKRTFMITLN